MIPSSCESSRSQACWWKAVPLQQREEVADTPRNERGCDRKEKYFEKFCLQVGAEWLLENWALNIFPLL